MILHHTSLGAGAPLYILHGLFGSSDNWSTLSKSFAEDRKVILVDQRNHGRSFHDAGMDYDFMAQDLLALMDHLGHAKADLLGHSMGGKTVMRLAIHHPDRVNKLIVADIGPQAYPSHHDTILEALTSVPIDKVSARNEVIDSMREHISNEGVLQFLGKNLYWIEKGRLAWRMNLEVIAASMDAILASVGVETYDGETLFIKGGSSDYIQDEDEMALQMQFPASEIVTLEGAGHWLHAEQPERFYEEVVSFLG